MDGRAEFLDGLLIVALIEQFASALIVERGGFGIGLLWSTCHWQRSPFRRRRRCRWSGLFRGLHGTFADRYERRPQFPAPALARTARAS